MDMVHRTAEVIVRDIAEFAKRHGLIVPDGDCLAKHARRVVQLGRCPCAGERSECPCTEVFADLERLGRCECGILVDPVRIGMLKGRNSSQ
ncbi:MAG TPA: hypothetical protein ENL12_05325 [Dehalococcoidia bacterium]|nr:hypothetical protein [Dehalococcoidia bacterium]